MVLMEGMVRLACAVQADNPVCLDSLELTVYRDQVDNLVFLERPGHQEQEVTQAAWVPLDFKAPKACPAYPEKLGCVEHLALTGYRACVVYPDNLASLALGVSLANLDFPALKVHVVDQVNEDRTAVRVSMVNLDLPDNQALTDYLEDKENLERVDPTDSPERMVFPAKQVFAGLLDNQVIVYVLLIESCIYSDALLTFLIILR